MYSKVYWVYLYKCMNDKEEENSGTEFESDSDIYSASDKEQCISLAQKHKQLLRHL